MESLNLMGGIKFNDSHPIAQPIHVDKNGRLLQFALKPGQAFFLQLIFSGAQLMIMGGTLCL